MKQRVVEPEKVLNAYEFMMLFPRESPRMFFTLLGMVLCLWRVLTGITELIQGMVCFISLATRFPDPRPEGHGELTPLGELFALCGQGEDSCFLRLSSHTVSVDFHPTAFLRDLPGPPCQKKGIEYPSHSWGLDAGGAPCIS